jgi:prophage regulatory protein
MTVDKYLRIKQVAELVGLSRATIYNMEKAGTFPKKTPLGERAVAWRESEITAWMESRQNIEKTEKEKRPGKPPTKKQKPIEPAVAAKVESKPLQTAPTEPAAIVPKTVSVTADDDWSEDAPPQTESELGVWETVQRPKPRKVSLPKVGVLSRSSKEVPIVLNPAVKRTSKVIELKDFSSKKNKTKP